MENGLKLSVNRFNTSGVLDFISFDDINNDKKEYEARQVFEDGCTSVYKGCKVQGDKIYYVTLTFINNYIVSAEYKKYIEHQLKVNTLYVR